MKSEQGSDWIKSLNIEEFLKIINLLFKFLFRKLIDSDNSFKNYLKLYKENFEKFKGIDMRISEDLNNVNAIKKKIIFSYNCLLI